MDYLVFPINHVVDCIHTGVALLHYIILYLSLNTPEVIMCSSGYKCSKKLAFNFKCTICQLWV